MATIRTRLRVTALCCAMFTTLAASTLAADAGKGPYAELRERLADNTLLFEHYSRDTIQDWTRIHTDLTKIMVDKDSVKLAVFERTRADGSRERRIVFLGTDLLSPDVRYDIAEYLPGLGFSQRTDAARQMYVQAIALATGIVNKARQDGVHIEVDGYSRGGPMATVVAGRLGIPATTYNTMALKLGLEFLDDQQRAQAQRLTVNVYRRDDLSLSTVAIPGAVSLGSTLIVEPPPFDLGKLARVATQRVVDAVNVVVAFH